MVTVLSHVSARTRPGRPEMIQAAGTRPAELVGGREEVSDQSPLLLKLSAIYTGASPQGQTPGGDPARQPPAMALGRQLAAAAKHSFCSNFSLSPPINIFPGPGSWTRMEGAGALHFAGSFT